ncbi:MAG: hypothetical protein JKX93_12145 [Rhizobiaceae bacterium]|nr:hypothetical protein [Rhizobiaceae bacterium]
MVNEKAWYDSKTIWGALLAVAASIAGSLGLSIDGGAQQDLAEALVQLTGAAGALLAVYGRFTAVDLIN